MLNRDGLNTPPCLTPPPTCMDFDRAIFHFKQFSRLQYQEIETKHLGKPDLTS